MQYESIRMVSTYVAWLIGIADAVLILRVIYIMYTSMTDLDEHCSFSAALKKAKTRVVAAVICTIIESLILLIKSYLFR